MRATICTWSPSMHCRKAEYKTGISKPPLGAGAFHFTRSPSMDASEAVECNDNQATGVVEKKLPGQS